MDVTAHFQFCGNILNKKVLMHYWILWQFLCQFQDIMNEFLQKLLELLIPRSASIKKMVFDFGRFPWNT